LIQKLSFIEHFSTTFGSGTNVWSGNVEIFALSPIAVGKITVDEDFVCGGFKPLLGCILLLLYEYSFLKDFVRFDESLTLGFLKLERGSLQKEITNKISVLPLIKYT